MKTIINVITSEEASFESCWIRSHYLSYLLGELSKGVRLLTTPDALFFSPNVMVHYIFWRYENNQRNYFGIWQNWSTFGVTLTHHLHQECSRSIVADSTHYKISTSLNLLYVKTATQTATFAIYLQGCLFSKIRARLMMPKHLRQQQKGTFLTLRVHCWKILRRRWLNLFCTLIRNQQSRHLRNLKLSSTLRW